MTVYGEVQLDNDEKEFMKLGPKFSLLADINIRNMKTDLQIYLTRVRWTRIGLDLS